MNDIPFVEKYRPSNINDIVLGETNRRIMGNIIKSKHFPNLLFYGPPGTGKTTSVINLVNAFNDNDQRKKKLVIHLNASDERGIDVIRNQINTFVSSKNLFVNGTKIVILDEVDYMTKSAQQALRHVLHQTYGINDVRFCLICNYITKIEESLQNEFVRLRFNKLPVNVTLSLLQNVNISENIGLTEKSLKYINQLFKSDIRSMMNYMQSIHETNVSINVINDALWLRLTQMLEEKILQPSIFCFLKDTSKLYNTSTVVLLKEYLNYVIRDGKYLSFELLDVVEFLVHDYNIHFEHSNKYLIYRLHYLYNQKI